MRDLYLKPSEIEILPLKQEEAVEAYNWFRMITQHEHSGLKELGCEINISPECTFISHPNNDIKFMNRVTNILMNQSEFEEMIESLDSRYSIVINSFTQPINAISILERLGYVNSISSTVIGSEIPRNLPTVEHNFTFVNVAERNEDFEHLYNVFSIFFLKPGETESEAKKRVENNLSRGSHILIRENHKDIGMIGTIDSNKLSSIYCGIIIPEYRSTNVLDALAVELSEALYKKGISHYYGKSRNRAFLIGLKRLLKFEHLFNEKIYILDAAPA